MQSDSYFWILWTSFSLFWMVLVGYLTISTYIQDKNEYELLAQEGLWTEGRVVNRREEVSYDDDDDGPSITYYVTYQYTVSLTDKESRQLEVDQVVDYETYQRAEKGGRAKLIYAPSDPEIFRPEPEFTAPTDTDLALACCMPLFGLPFTLLGLWMLRHEVS